MGGRKCRKFGEFRIGFRFFLCQLIKACMDIDDKAWRLISALQADGRASLKALAEAVGLSVPAT